MTAKELKASILDRAIRGALVPQDPRDEPASALVARIRKERAAASARHGGRARRPATAAPPLIPDDEKPFDIPKSWQWVRLGEVLEPMTSKKPSGERFDYIDIDAIDNKANVVREIKTLPTQGATSRASREVRENDVLFSIVRPYLRNIAIIDKEHAHCIASTGFYVCRPTEVFNSRYLYWLMLSDYVVSGLNQFMKGNNSPSITTKDIVDYPIPLPPLAEQGRIVAKVEALRAALARL